MRPRSRRKERTSHEGEAKLLADVPGCVIVRRHLSVGHAESILYQSSTPFPRRFFVGRSHANYVYVDDVANALTACAVSAGATGTYIVSDDRPLEDFIGAIARELGRKPPRLRVPEPAARLAAKAVQHIPGIPLTPSRVAALARKVAYPSARIKSELGFTFRVSVEEGLRRLIAHSRGQP
jgi:nucleoside-diphosphate-sugar epimerase